MAGTADVQIGDISMLRDTVYSLTGAVAQLTEQMQALTSNPTSDPGGAYSGDEGPAVRIRFYEVAPESDRMRMDELDGCIASLEIAIGDIQGTQGEYQGVVDTIVSDGNRLEESREELWEEDQAPYGQE